MSLRGLIDMADSSLNLIHHYHYAVQVPRFEDAA